MLRISLLLSVAGLLLAAAIAVAKPANITSIATQESVHQSGKNVTFTESIRVGKKLIGHDKVTCTGVSGAVFNCNGTFTFKNGTVSAAGRVNEAKKDNTLKITGGTGSYAGAKGTLKLHDLASASANRTKETLLFS